MDVGQRVRINVLGWRVGNDAGRIGVITRRIQPEWDSQDWDMWEVTFPDGKWAYGENGRVHWFRGDRLQVME